MKSILFPAALLAALSIASPAFAHAIAGDRVFPVTLLTDDPGVTDEASLPTISYMKNGDDPSAEELDVGIEFDKTITEDFGVSIAGTWTRLSSPEGTPSGLQNLEVGGKYHVFTNAPHEFIVSVGLSAELGGTGSSNVGADPHSTLVPTLFFGKGMGDLPPSLDLLRPFAVTGVFGYDIPLTSEGFQSIEYGAAVEYSLPYLHANVRDIGLPDFFNHITPLVEMAFSTPTESGSDGHTTGTINPGFIWSGTAWQFGIEAMFPINRASGTDPGFIAQLHFFFDDLFPDSIGKPLFASK